MLHLVAMSLFVALFLRDAGPRPPLLRALSPGWVAALTLGTLLAVALAAHGAVWALGRRIDRTGDPRCVARADAVIGLSRPAIALVHAAAVLALGWLDVVRRVTGDLVLVDEALAVAPALLALAAGWWTIYPVDRRVREATLLRRLETGRSVHPIPTRSAFVAMGVRHHVALVAVPVAMVAAWGEAVTLGAERWLGRAPPTDAVLGAVAALQLAGAVAAFGLIAPVMTRIWKTVPLGESELRARLVGLCRAHRVRVRDLLVWRTEGTMVNGAVMGLFPPLRYVLLTDSLLESLGEREVEAVMAHEVGHIRRRHMIWLGLALLAAVSWAGLGAQWAALSLWGRGPWTEVSAMVASLAGAAAAFGFVSRRFEWQADAFAAAHLSRAGLPGGRAVTIGEEAVGTMCGALERVAALNHIDPERFSWRHGSIASRWRRLRRISGRSSGRLPIDRQVLALKVGAVAALGLVVALGVFDALR